MLKGYILSYLGVLVTWHLGMRFQYGHGAARDDDSFHSRAALFDTRVSMIADITLRTGAYPCSLMLFTMPRVP
jgi:hypothetical protein